MRKGHSWLQAACCLSAVALQNIDSDRTHVIRDALLWSFASNKKIQVLSFTDMKGGKNPHWLLLLSNAVLLPQPHSGGSQPSVCNCHGNIPVFPTYQTVTNIPFALLRHSLKFHCQHARFDPCF